MPKSKLSLKRPAFYIESPIQDELLVYDQSLQKVHLLHQPAVRLYSELKEGPKSLEALQRSTGFSKEELDGHIGSLAAADLIECEVSLDRRELLAATAAVTSLAMLPLPAAAASTTCAPDPAQQGTAAQCAGCSCGTTVASGGNCINPGVDYDGTTATGQCGWNPDQGTYPRPLSTCCIAFVTIDADTGAVINCNCGTDSFVAGNAATRKWCQICCV